MDDAAIIAPAFAEELQLWGPILCRYSPVCQHDLLMNANSRRPLLLFL
jgi:hypothetical protein